MMRREQTWHLDAPPERVWPYVSDTDAINRLAGTPPVTYAFDPQADGSVRVRGTMRNGPLTIRWDERPFAWSAPEYHDVERIFLNGPLRSFRARTELTARDGGTRVRTVCELEGRGRLVEPFLPAIAARGFRGLDRAMARVAAELRASPDRPAPDDVPKRFAPLVAAGFDRATVARFARHLRDADDARVARIRPFELADELGVPRREMLRLCLAATRAGLLDLSWSVLCTSCGGPNAKLERLGDLGVARHCDACNIGFDPAFDRSVEVTFDAGPLGRKVDVPVYCMGGPGAGRHVVAQAALAPKSAVAFDVALPEGQYVARALGASVLAFASARGTDDGPLRVRVGSEIAGIPAEVASGRRAFAATNDLPHDVVLRIEKAEWPDTIATAAQVTAIQEFRDLFSSDVLAPGVEVSIRTLAILFTDVVGSTAMYRTGGDASAFRAVSDHFEAIRAVIAPRGGAIVKTIGDAVMAVFVDAKDCFDAAMLLDGAVGHLTCGDVPLRLRVGFHAGACIAMRANDRLDYFGTTVNLAARLQGKARAGEVAMSEADALRPGIAEALAEMSPHRDELVLKGIGQPITVVRVAAASGRSPLPASGP